MIQRLLPLFILNLLLAVAASAQTIVVSAKVNDRALDGSAIRGQFKYPSAMLESGSKGYLHIGKNLRYPVWVETVQVSDAMTKPEVSYEETPIGLELDIKVAAEGATITYSGEARVSVTRGVSEEGASYASTVVTFMGKVANDEMIAVELEGPDGTTEEILLHFGIKPADE
ncbi:hypothetical protein [Coraliomargarita parva]|uniref:hypothetical protein n=1 Tax=Coraliomargarita parva TaxID=3014050 RepID=UPI0022B32D1E|nr:hypothetical protein [Coraliomargarita parva]